MNLTYYVVNIFHCSLMFLFFLCHFLRFSQSHNYAPCGTFQARSAGCDGRLGPFSSKDYSSVLPEFKRSTLSESVQGLPNSFATTEPADRKVGEAQALSMSCCSPWPRSQILASYSCWLRSMNHRCRGLMQAWLQRHNK